MIQARRSIRATNEQLGLAGALVLLGALVAGLVWHAQSRVRSHRATAEEALRHQAAVAAWQYHRYAAEGLLHSVHTWTAPLAPLLRRSEGELRRRQSDGGLPRKPPPDCSACGGAPVRPLYSFRLALAARSLSVIDSASIPPPEPARRLLAARLAATVAGGESHDYEPHGLFVDTVAGALQVVAYGIVRGSGAPRELYGMVIEPRHLRGPLSKPLGEALLPPAVLGRIPMDSVLHVSVRTRSGAPVYESGFRPATTLAAADTLGPRFGALVATVTLRPERAPALLIGGVPRANWPLLSAVLALAVLLTALALLQLRRMRELARLRSRFVASVSHELRTPLAQISMFSETLLLDRARSNEERVDFLSAIFREARRLTNLVESVLRFSRADGAPVTPRLHAPESQDVSAEIVDTLRGFAPLAAASDVELLPDIVPGVEAMLEPGAIRQLLLNLLDNAIKYGPRGQTVTVRLGAGNHTLRLAVEDEGPGVPAEERSRVFEPFARIEHGPRSRVAGTGIGLSVVRDIAAAHGGRAWIEDGPSGGARVVVEMPLLQKDQGRGTRDERAFTRSVSASHTSPSVAGETAPHDATMPWARKP
jgi:signal transduction histidine kinase